MKNADCTINYLVPFFHEIFVFLSLLAIAYTGTIKLKQSWLDQFENGDSAESKILTGNIEQAVRLIVALLHNNQKIKIDTLKLYLVHKNYASYFNVFIFLLTN